MHNLCTVIGHHMLLVRARPDCPDRKTIKQSCTLPLVHLNEAFPSFLHYIVVCGIVEDEGHFPVVTVRFLERRHRAPFLSSNENIKMHTHSHGYLMIIILWKRKHPYGWLIGYHGVCGTQSISLGTIAISRSHFHPIPLIPSAQPNPVLVSVPFTPCCLLSFPLFRLLPVPLHVLCPAPFHFPDPSVDPFPSEDHASLLRKFSPSPYDRASEQQSQDHPQSWRGRQRFSDRNPSDSLNDGPHQAQTT